MTTISIGQGWVDEQVARLIARPGEAEALVSEQDNGAQLDAVEEQLDALADSWDPDADSANAALAALLQARTSHGEAEA